MNTELQKFIDHFGGVTKTAEKLGCTPDMVRKLRNERRELTESRIVQIYKLMPRISLKRLLRIDR